MWDPDSAEAMAVRKRGYEMLRRERLAFEALMIDPPRTHLETILRRQRQGAGSDGELVLSANELEKLKRDAIDVCLRLNPQKWEVKWKDLLASLRHAKWAPIQAPHKWRIPIDAEEDLKDKLRIMGFQFSTVGDYTIKVMPMLRQEVSPRRRITPVVSGEHPIRQRLLKLPSDKPMELVEELLAELADPKVAQSEKKRIRAKLRRLGHHGGLRDATT